jgi:hypothetical protein
MLNRINTIDDGHHHGAALLTIGMERLHLDHLHATTANMSGAFEVDRRHLRLLSILILEM